jgi:hypothetical protein
MEPVPARVRVEALHLRLCGRIAELHRPPVADVVRAFLEVAVLAGEQLRSLEFVFDEDEGRVARLEARFWGTSDASEDVPGRGFEVRLTLPRILPLRTPAQRQKAAERVLSLADKHGSLVNRFIAALSELGAYRAVEPVELLSAEAHLL